VLVGEQGAVSARELRGRAFRVAELLPASTPGSVVAFAFERDRTAFVAALLGVWARGHCAALPENARRRCVAPVLARPDVRLLVHDTGAGTGLDVARLLAERPATDAAETPLPLHGALQVHVAHAGSAIAERRWSANELAAATAAAADRLALPAGACVWSAFRPASPHALLPGTLAPLRSGARVGGAPLVGTEVLAALGVHTLVAPASLLRAFARRGVRPSGLVQVVAGDEPLDPRTAGRLEAIGVRNVPAPGEAPVDERLGILHRLLAHDQVTDAAVEVVHFPDGPHAFCAASAPEGAEEALRQELPAGMAATFLFADPLPRDPDGALAPGGLLRLFGRDAAGRAPSQRLLFCERRGEGERTFRTQVPADFFGFEGHFETYPVLSSAVQLHELVLPCVRAVLGDVAAAAFHDLKFLARIAPGDTVDVAVRRDAAGTACDFEIRRGDVRCSTGRMLLRGAGPEAAP
jgi:hypothetical protein